jgi:dihydrodipicolinate synthase/N-acetylneuraminate lyase
MILSTPYTRTGAVDYEDLAGQVDFLDPRGVHGYVWPQLSSDYAYLSKPEKLRGMEVLADAVRGKSGALVLGVQADDTAGMLEMVGHAESLAPDGLIAMPPKQASTLDDVRRYFHALCEATERPIFVQTTGGADIEPTVDFLVDLARRYPHCAYVKEEWEPVAPRIRELIAHRPDPIRRVFTATYGLGWPYHMRLGVDGVMTGGTMYAEVYVRLWDLYLERRLDEARDVFGKLLLILNLDGQIPGIRQYVLQRRGIFKTMVSRRGDYTFTAEAKAEIEHRLEVLRPYMRD